MNLIITFWNKLKNWLGIGKEPSYQVKTRDDIPDSVKNNTLYLIGEEPHIWCGVMICPCGCGEKIHLSLLPTGSPKWNYHKHQDGTFSIQPSIWRTKGCCSHFFLKQNRIIWCNHSVQQ